ncbi:putative transcription factor interactor and regulator CCHC(Zn) family [Helianthus anomalus]
MDDKQRLYNHTASYNNIGVLTNTALVSQQGFGSFQMFPSSVTNPTNALSTVLFPSNLGTYISQSGYFPAPIQQVNPTQFAPQSTPASAQAHPATSTTFAATNWSTHIAVSKEFEENMVFMTRVMNCYHAFITRKMANKIASTEQHEVHPDDIEETDITWQMAMAVFRAKKFVKRTGRNKWKTADHELGWKKSKLRCYNCHEPRHFARECRQPQRERSDTNVTVTVSSAAWPAPNVVSTSNITVSRPVQGSPSNTVVRNHTSSSESVANP